MRKIIKFIYDIIEFIIIFAVVWLYIVITSHPPDGLAPFIY